MTSENRVIGGLADRIRCDRRVAGIAVAGLVGALLSPGYATAAAASARCEIQDFSSIAAADLLKADLHHLDLFGAQSPKLAGVTLAAARSWVNSTAATKSRASMDYLDAEVLGTKIPTGLLDGSVSQSAPPNNARPATYEPSRLNTDLLRIGPGPLSAHATWKREYGCRTEQGVIAESKGSGLDATVLPAVTTKREHSVVGNGLVALPSNAFSRTATGLTNHEGTMTTAASAWTGLTELVLFQGTERQTTVRVINPPELTALATGSKRTSTVKYTSPVLEIVTPDGKSQRLDAPGRAVTLTIPPSDAPEAANKEKADTKPEHAPKETPKPGPPDGVPAADETAPEGTDRGLIGGLLGGLTGGSRHGEAETTPPSGADTTAGDPTDQPGDDSTDRKAEGKEQARDTEARSVPALTVRIGLGEVDSHITHTAVRAEAASVQLQLAAVRDGRSTTIGEVALGKLKAYATAPHAATPSNPPVTTPPSSGGGGSLPVTGVNVLAVLATGALLLVIGRFLMVFGRRKEVAADTPPH